MDLVEVLERSWQLRQDGRGVAKAQRATFDAQSSEMEAKFTAAVNGAMKAGLAPTKSWPWRSQLSLP